MGYELADAMLNAYGAGQQIAANRAKLTQAKAESDRRSRLTMAQQEEASGMPQNMQLGFPREYQAQQAAGEKAAFERQGEQQARRKLPQLVYEVAAQYGLGPGQEEAILRDGRVGIDIQRRLRAQTEGAAKGSGNMIMPGGGTAMPTGAVASAIGDVRQIDKELDMLNNMNNAIKNAGGHQQLSSIPEAGKAAWGGFISRLNSNLVSPDEVKKFGARGAAVAEVATFRNMIFNKLSGAAVSESEMKRLMESVPDVSDPWYIREAKMASWDNNLRMARDAGYDDITQGIKAMGGKMSRGWDKTNQSTTQGQTAPAQPDAFDPNITDEEQQFLNEYRKNKPK